MDQYREFILSILRVCPQTRETNILYRLKESFPDFECNKRTFYRYMHILREQTGFVQFTGRVTSPREESPPGYEAQVDFGQFRMKDMYGKQVRVYFFYMVLSYSRMHYVYFSRETAIEAHEYAFRYFGGRTQMIMYDQDRVFVVDENFGNIVLVSKFEEYVRRTGFCVRLCRPHDPQSIGKVESFVRYVKESFLEGGIYYGIDALNSEALRWLDTEGNGTSNARTRQIPRVMFREESKHLVKVHAIDAGMTDIRSVSDKYTVKVDWSVIFITNRELSEWQQAAEDKHLMQTLADKISSDSQLIRLS
ncbi:MAG: DDE-type integrase/transposase/recombinase [Clostridiales bacterium]|nr:DDE-type integrase/transposase/recombinase [Clostridiales bacterium]